MHVETFIMKFGLYSPCIVHTVRISFHKHSAYNVDAVLPFFLTTKT